MLALRKSLSPSERSQAEVKILQFLNQIDEVRGAKGLGLYWSVGSEVPTHHCFAQFHDQGKYLFLPRCRLGREPLEMVGVASPRDLALGPFGTYEPNASFPAVNLGEFSVLLVPGLAFDRFGNRLGRGRGFYDRLLAEFKGLKLALAFGVQVLERVPTEAHDEPVDGVVTEQEIIWCEK